MSYRDDIIAEFYCETCELAKVTKKYNQIPRPWLKVKCSEFSINLVKFFILQSFQNKKYFFTFIDGTTQEIDTFIGLEKRE